MWLNKITNFGPKLLTIKDNVHYFQTTFCIRTKLNSPRDIVKIPNGNYAILRETCMSCMWVFTMHSWADNCVGHVIDGPMTRTYIYLVIIMTYGISLWILSFLSFKILQYFFTKRKKRFYNMVLTLKILSACWPSQYISMVRSIQSQIKPNWSEVICMI